MQAKSSTYSSVTALVAGLFAVSVVTDLAGMQLGWVDKTAIVVLLVVCIVFGVYALVKGKRLSSSAGILMACVHGVVSAVVLGFTSEYLRAVAFLQEMPLIALYLAWFYPRRAARATMIVYLGLVVLIGTVGPAEYLQGLGTWHEVLRLVLFLLLAMEVGFLWRRRVDTDSHIDQLTGVYTRDGMYAHGPRELSRAKRYNTPLVFVIVDLDDFKEVNDTAGHNAGDRVLAKVAEELRMNVRSTDLVFRFGGDEFSLLLPHTNIDQAGRLMERLRSQSSHPWSWGASQLEPEDSLESLAIRADQSMYLDKKRRRGEPQNGQ